jgi:hypothetical protein
VVLRKAPDQTKAIESLNKKIKRVPHAITTLHYRLMDLTQLNKSSMINYKRVIKLGYIFNQRLVADDFNNGDTWTTGRQV